MWSMHDATEAIDEQDPWAIAKKKPLSPSEIRRCRRLLQQQEQLRLLDVASSSLSAIIGGEEEEDRTVVSSVLTNVIGVLLCVTFVAIVAGLFLGLLTLDVLDLRIIQRASIDEDERMYATALIPIVEQRHRVLVTLLLLNALAYEALPIFMDRLVPTWVAILLSTTVVLLFGEILPSGVFTGPHQLYLGYKVLPLMKFFLFIMYPFATPMAWLLDYLVSYGKENSHQDLFYNRGELSALVRIQYEERIATKATKLQKNAMTIGFDTSRDKWAKLKAEILEAVSEKREHTVRSRKESEADVEASIEEQMHPPLHAVEIKVMEGSLQLKTRVALDVYTPINKVFALPSDMVLDKANVSYIYGKGYSRVPVYDRKEVKYNEHEEEYHEDITGMVGVLMSRQLMLIDWDDNRLVESLPLQFPECVSPRINLVDLLQILRSHGFLMAFVCARPDLANRALDNEQPLPPEAGFMGIVTLEDILESILGDRIYDEGDIRDRDRAVATLRRWAAVTLQKLWRRRQLRRRSSRSLSPMRRKFDNHSNHGTDSNSFGTSSSRHNNNHRESENTPLLYKSSSFTYR